MHLHASIMHHVMIITLSMHLLSRVVNPSEKLVATTGPVLEEYPPIEIGFDIYGSSEDPDISVNQGKPRSI